MSAAADSLRPIYSGRRKAVASGRRQAAGRPFKPLVAGLAE